MRRRVVYHTWDSALGDFVERPLDEADPWTLSLANQINGKDLTKSEFDRIISLHGADVGRGLTSD